MLGAQELPLVGTTPAASGPRARFLGENLFAFVSCCPVRGGGQITQNLLLQGQKPSALTSLLTGCPRVSPAGVVREAVRLGLLAGALLSLRSCHSVSVNKAEIQPLKGRAARNLVT